MSDTPPREWRSVLEESERVSARRLDGECALVAEAQRHVDLTWEARNQAEPGGRRNGGVFQRLL